MLGMHNEIQTPQSDEQFWLICSELRTHPSEKLLDEFGHTYNPDFEFIAHARIDIPALLDALEAETKRADDAEARNNYLGFTAKEWHEKGVVVKEGLEKVFVECMIDRDRRKAHSEEAEAKFTQAALNCVHVKKRSEALERAICEYGWGYCNDFACKICTRYSRDCDSNNCNWQFDESRFTNKEPYEPNQQQQ